MYELIKVGEKTYYIDSPTKIGVYVINGKDAVLIDSGLDAGVARKVLKILTDRGWTLSLIINTHYHADHMGGNAALQKSTGCRIISDEMTPIFAKYNILMPTVLYGGYPHKELFDKFLCSEPSEVTPASAELLPDGIEIAPLDGHTFSMIGVHTDDGVWFVADALVGENILDKYCVSYLLDVKNYLLSLEKVKTLRGKLFIPAHAEPTEDITALADKNIANTKKIIATIEEICREPAGIDDIVSEIFRIFGAKLTLTQHTLVSTTVRSFVSYMLDENLLTCGFFGTKLCYSANNLS